jgi:drug/metabolite transporter (DMT)-like permease
MSEPFPEGQQRPVEQTSPSPWMWVLLATVPLTWGFNFISLKILKQTFGVAGPLAGVYGMLSARYALMVVALMLTLWIIERDLTIRREHWRYLVGFAFVTVVIYQGTFSAGVFYTLAAEGALLISTAPIWAALINHVLGWEKLTVRQAVGTIIGFVGIAAVVLGGLDSTAAPEHHTFGVAIMVLAGILWASYAVFSKPLLKHYSPLKVTAWIHTLGAVVLIPLGAPRQCRWTGRTSVSSPGAACCTSPCWQGSTLLWYGSGAYRPSAHPAPCSFSTVCPWSRPCWHSCCSKRCPRCCRSWASASR